MRLHTGCTISRSMAVRMAEYLDALHRCLQAGEVARKDWRDRQIIENKNANRVGSRIRTPRAVDVRGDFFHAFRTETLATLTAILGPADRHVAEFDRVTSETTAAALQAGIGVRGAVISLISNGDL